MKIRSGFVSNSSSSSFLISFPKKPDITLEEIIADIRKDYWIFAHEKAEYFDECKKIIEKVTEEFNRGYQVIYYNVSSEDSAEDEVESLVNKFGGIVQYVED